MNASQPTPLRALRGLGQAALFLTVLAACSDDQASTPLPPAGPATLEITGIALGQNFVGSGGASSVLACDYTIGVNVRTTNWTLLGPGRCGGALQCGQLRVTLLDLDGLAGAERLKQVAAGNGVALDVRPLLSETPPLKAGKFAVKVELVDDAGTPYVGLAGGNGSAQVEFDMELPDEGACTSTPEAPGSAGASGAGSAGDGGSAGDDSAGGGGAGGDSAAAGGTGGDSAAGSGNAGGGTGGDSAAGSGNAGGGNAGSDNAGSAGTGGNAGSAGR